MVLSFACFGPRQWFPLLIPLMPRFWHSSSRYNVLCYDTVWAENRSHHLSYEKRMDEELRYSKIYLFLIALCVKLWLVAYEILGVKNGCTLHALSSSALSRLSKNSILFYNLLYASNILNFYKRNICEFYLVLIQYII